MEGSYEEYKRACERIREDNTVYLEIFRKSLVGAGLSVKTITRHVDNVDFYLNVYLLAHDASPMPEGVDSVGPFLGDWFIRKCTWSSPTSIKQYAASLKKFYQCMLSAD